MFVMRVPSFLLFLSVPISSAFVPQARTPLKTLPCRAYPTKYSSVVNQKGNPVATPCFSRSSVELEAKRDTDNPETDIRKKLVAESIAPWRTLRLFLYFSLGSGAALGGLVTLPGVIAGLSGARPDLDMNTEYLNLAIDFGAAAAFAVFAKLDLDKGSELSQKVEEKFERKKESKRVQQRMAEREKRLGDLSLNIRISTDGEMKVATVSELQSSAKQHMIIVAGPRKAIRDALLGANLMKMSDFAMSNVLVVPYEIGTKDVETKPSGGFGDKPTWESKPYVADPSGDGWDDYVQEEMDDAVEQSGQGAKEDGIAIVVANSGKVIRRGVGTVPWRSMVDELTEAVTGEKKEMPLEIPFLSD